MAGHAIHCSLHCNLHGIAKRGVLMHHVFVSFLKVNHGDGDIVIMPLSHHDFISIINCVYLLAVSVSFVSISRPARVSDTVRCVPGRLKARTLRISRRVPARPHASCYGTGVMSRLVSRAVGAERRGQDSEKQRDHVWQPAR